MDELFYRDVSPLRYPGSKQKLVKYFERILSFNSVSPDVIVEPFVGGGSTFLYFLVCRLAQKAIIGDRDRVIYSFWKVLFSQPQILIDFVLHVKVNVDTFYEYKDIAKNEQSFDNETLAKACLFLNRTSFSGIIAHSAGPIGGRSQVSQYKIDCRFNRKLLVDKIRYINSFADSVIVLNHDWGATVSYAQDWAAKENNTGHLFFYFDPPFFYKAQGLYRTFFEYSDHERLCKFLFSFPEPWILSYDNASEIRAMYGNNIYKPLHVEMPYSVNSHAKRIEKELIITPLDLPDI
jgi:DNA adenine methylase